MKKLVPGQSKLFRKIIKIVEKRLRDVFVTGIVPEGKVARQHGRLVEFVRIERIGVRSVSTSGLPLLGTTRAGNESPVMAQKGEKELCLSLASEGWQAGDGDENVPFAHLVGVRDQITSRPLV